MEIEALVSLFTNTTVSVGCLIYFMWYNSKYAERTNTLLQELKTVIEIMNDRINKIEEKLEEKN